LAPAKAKRFIRGTPKRPAAASIKPPPAEAKDAQLIENEGRAMTCSTTSASSAASVACRTGRAANGLGRDHSRRKSYGYTATLDEAKAAFFKSHDAD